MSQEEFARYEDMAIDGRLIYDEYPAEEYKYFSQLSRLGYKNRHEGWSKEICEDKQAEYKREYLHSKERNGRFFRQACIMQENIRRGQTTVWKINKASDPAEKLEYALQALELILCDEGLAKHNGVSIPEYTGCEYCKDNQAVFHQRYIGEEDSSQLYFQRLQNCAENVSQWL